MANIKTQSLPPPYKGLNDNEPLAALSYPYAEVCTNFNLDQSVPMLRHGDSVFSNSAVAGDSIRKIATYGDSEKLFAVGLFAANNNIWDITAGGVGTIALAMASGGNDAATLYFDKYLYVCFYGGGADGLVVSYDGTSWTNPAPYTWPANFHAFGGCVFKNRSYWINRYLPDSSQNMCFGYSDIDAIGGAVTKVDLSSIVSNKGSLLGIRSISIVINSNTQNVLCFIFSTGEVLVYAGTYPDDPDNWGIVNRFIIPHPNDYNSFIDVKGDTFIITEVGPVSLRQLLSQGVDVALEEGIGALIKNRWAQIRKVTGLTQAIYDTLQERLIIYTTAWVDPDTGYTDGLFGGRLIYSFRARAWFEHKFYQGINFVSATAYFNKQVYAGYFNYRAVAAQEGYTGFVDASLQTSVQNVNMDYLLRTAPLPLTKFGVSEITNLEALMASDQYVSSGVGLLKARLIGNLGAVTTGYQTVEDQGPAVANPSFELGLSANYCQAEISGFSVDGTVGIEIYALNLWSGQPLEGGGRPG